MGLFTNKKLVSENEQLKARNAYLEYHMSPEMRECDSIVSTLAGLRKQHYQIKEAQEKAMAEVMASRAEKNSLDVEIQKKKSLIQDIEETLLMEEFGLYQPKFAFANSTQYKDALKLLRDKQKLLLKQANEAAKSTNWTVNGSKVEGRKMVCDTQKLLMRAYNNECDDLISKVKSTNIERTVERISKISETISKLGRVVGVSVSQSYVDAKTKEAYLAYEFAQAKDKEKEEIRHARAREREELKAQKEIMEKRKQLEKEQIQYKKALAEAKTKIESASVNDRNALEEKISELEAHLNEVEKGIVDVDYREANKRAGFVYVISNIGSFGENVYKIGMTRRLDPMERVSELSDASVPFVFDVHALIFSNDAPGLETALHREFESRKLNLVNQRREFFRCSLDEIKRAVMKSYDKTVEFVDVPDAEQFRVSEKMRLRR